MSIATKPVPWAAREGIDDPASFQSVWLNRKLWAKEREIVRSVAKHRMTAVKGCHASGKTFTAAGMPLHVLTANKKGKAFITAPTLRQVVTFWGEIALARSGGPIAQILPEPNKTGLFLNADRYAIGASSSRGVNLQGLHGDNVLIIADEAPGIQADIWDAIEGIRAGGRVNVLKLGNPVVPSGAFYDAFTKEAAIHNCISISAFDTPNFRHPDGRTVTIEEILQMSDEDLDYAPYPYLVNRRWVKERYLAWGPNHPGYRSRVLAEFPSSDPCGVFPLDWIERAQRDPTEKELRMADRCLMQVGIDVAGAGKDETVLTARIGGIILQQIAWPDADPRGPVVAELKRLKRHPQYRLGMTVVDTVGIGYNFALHLVDQGIDVFGFNAGARAIDNAQFVNQKAEAHFTLRDAMQADQISGLTDRECAAQMSTIRYRENSRGLVEIESKEQRNQRGIPGSPDRAESLIMAFMRVIPAVQQEVVGGPDAYQISPI
jgi:phage terminase large subunit